MTTVQEGDVIVYAREDNGGAIQFEVGGVQRGWLLTPGEDIAVGTDIPVELCNRFVEDGICAPKPAAPAAKSTRAKAGDGAPAGDPPAGS